jgi:hypothetical protein
MLIIQAQYEKQINKPFHHHPPPPQPLIETKKGCESNEYL